MICRSCGNEERASEGYPCQNCGTFICIMCTFRGKIYCSKCEGLHIQSEPIPAPRPQTPVMDWPEH